MDAINLLPAKPLDEITSRPRFDASPDQPSPGFSFANLLDQKNPPGSELAPAESPESPEENVEPPVVADPPGGTAELSTLMAMFSTMPSLSLPPAVLPLAGTAPREIPGSATDPDSLPANPETVSLVPRDPANPVPLPARPLGATPGSAADPDPLPATPEAASLTPRDPVNPIPPPARPLGAAPGTHDPRRSAAVEGHVPHGEATAKSALPMPAGRAVKPVAGVLSAPVPGAPEPASEYAEASSAIAPLVPIVLPMETFVGVASAPVLAPPPVAPRRDGSHPEPTSPVLPGFHRTAPALSSALVEALPVLGRAALEPAPVLAATPPPPSWNPAPSLPNMPGSEPEISLAVPQATSAITAPQVAVLASPEAQVLRAPKAPPRVEGTPQSTARTDFGATKPDAKLSFDGTFTAMQEGVMPDSSNPPAPAPQRIPLVAQSALPPTAGSILEGRVGLSASAVFQSHGSSSRQGEEQPAFQQQPDSTYVPAPSFGSATTPAAPEKGEPKAALQTEVETIIHRTIDASTQMRATGREHVEVRMRLDAGHELTVRLHLANGAVTPVFVTESQELRQALEQHWAQFSERAGDRTTRVTTPVFESPNSQSGMNDLNQRQREGRERAFAQTPDETFAGNNRTGREAGRRAHPQPATVASPAGLQLYA